MRLRSRITLDGCSGIERNERIACGNGATDITDQHGLNCLRQYFWPQKTTKKTRNITREKILYFRSLVLRAKREVLPFSPLCHVIPNEVRDLVFVFEGRQMNEAKATERIACGNKGLPRMHTKKHERICCANECLRQWGHGWHRSARIELPAAIRWPRMDTKRHEIQATDNTD